MSAPTPTAQRVEVTSPKHIEMIVETQTLYFAIERLREMAQSAAGTLPGFALAITLLEREAADAKSRAIFANLKLCAQNGIDLASMRNVRMSSADGRHWIEPVPMDLADMGEGQ